MSNLRIVTDSTSDLSESLRSELGIEVVPLNVHFGPETFKDFVEMSSQQFWAKLQSSPHHPKTSQPSPGDFLESYERMVAEGATEILSIHISNALSGTMGSAQIAASMLQEKHNNVSVTVVDTKTVSLGIGMLAIEATRMAQAGKSVQEIAAWVSAAAERTNVLFTLDTLEFLQKNGRIGRAQAFVGGLLNFKPILQIDREGIVNTADRVRGRAKVLPRIKELMAERVAPGRTIRVSMLHANAMDEANVWLEEFKRVYNVVETWIGDIGPVIATNAGPGTVGVAFYEV